MFARYRILWTSGEQKVNRDFHNRQQAILFLNHLILDCGAHDARLRVLRPKGGK